MADPKKIDYSALINILDTTWGRSSTPEMSSCSVKFSLIDGTRLKATYGAIVNFGREDEMVVVKRRQSQAADNLIKQLLDSAKKQYRELTGNSISFKQASDADDVAIIGHNPYNPRRVAKYTKVAVLDMG